MSGKNPVAAALLSLILAGLGQLYNRQYFKGLVFLAMDLITGFYYFKFNSSILFWSNIILSVYSAADAYLAAPRTSGHGSVEEDKENEQTKDFGGVRIY